MNFQQLLTQIYQTELLTAEQERQLVVMVQQRKCSPKQLIMVDQLLEDIIAGLIRTELDPQEDKELGISVEKQV